MNLAEIPSNIQLVITTQDLQNFAMTLLSGISISEAPALSNEPEQPISQEEAMRYLGKSRQTLASWRRKGFITAHVLGGRIYFLKSELLSALKKSK
jgi:hypothetical protein